MNDYCVCWDRSHNHLSIGRLHEVVELNEQRFRADLPGLVIVRMWLTRDAASDYIAEQRSVMARRQRVEEPA